MTLQKKNGQSSLICDWQSTLIGINSTIRDCIESLNNSSLKIVLVINDKNQLKGIVSDGDIRRGLLRGLSLQSPLIEVMNAKFLVVPEDLEKNAVLQIMLANKIQQIPVVNQDMHVLNLHILDEVKEDTSINNLMVIMAGGRGIRLLPHTQNCPKPMVEVAGKPMLEHIILRARKLGFESFLISVHHLGDIIEKYFGNGQKWGVNIEYLRETSPLGTAGALSLYSNFGEQPVLVTNGDVLTDVNYKEILDFHEKSSASATMAVRMHEWENPFGVVKIEGIKIVGFEEKPVSMCHINAGVYVLNQEALNLLDFNEYCDMPTLFSKLDQRGYLTVAYPLHEAWLDVGRPSDLKFAQLKN